MYRSKEIRWFFSEPNSHLANWFDALNMSFDTAEPRTDYYLPSLPDSIGIKLREGRIEIKQKIGEEPSRALTEQVIGRVEDWIRWGFSVVLNDELNQGITGNDKHNWINVRKTRLAVKIDLNEAGDFQFHSIKEPLPSGAQIEYTRILINQQIWYSFALEWFGDKFIELNDSFFSKMLGSSILPIEDSKSYPGFLKAHFSK